MGVNLRELFPQHPVPDGWYDGKRIAIDGHNVAFRYLTTIRGKDGDVLRSKETGRATSHILGFLGLVRQMRSAGAVPIIIWDGAIHPRKEATVRGRIAKREETQARAEAAKASGDLAEYARLMRGTVYLDPEMISDCSRMMEALGVAVVQAPHDGERYGAALCTAGHADAVATEDFDALVAGAPFVLRKAGGQNSFMHHLSDLEANHLTVEQLRQTAIVCGTDWHPGIKGFGPKTAVKMLQKYGDLRVLWQGGDTRAHKMVAEGAMTLEQFNELDEYIADLPKPDAPVAPKPCPDMATATADEIGLSHDRVLAAFC
jgi:flap endonuclease-1